MISFSLCLPLKPFQTSWDVGVWSRGKSLTDAECAGAGPYIAITAPSSHTRHTRTRGGAPGASGARLAFTSVPGQSCGWRSIRKMQPGLYDRCWCWEHAVSGLTICFAIMWCLRNLCTPSGPDWGAPCHQSPPSEPRSPARFEEATGVFMESIDKKFIDENISDNQDDGLIF